MRNLVDDALAMIDQHGTIAAMKWLAAAVAEAEREDCARVCDLLAEHLGDSRYIAAGKAIRQRRREDK